jgi:hypothetical protein
MVENVASREWILKRYKLPTDILKKARRLKV